jgi:hypothetical protein
MKAPGDPSTTDVANALGVHGQDLRQFAEVHPNPSVPCILGWAGADPEHRELVEEWLDRVENETNGRRVANGTVGGEKA